MIEREVYSDNEMEDPGKRQVVIDDALFMESLALENAGIRFIPALSFRQTRRILMFQIARRLNQLQETIYTLRRETREMELKMEECEKEVSIYKTRLEREREECEQMKKQLLAADQRSAHYLYLLSNYNVNDISTLEMISSANYQLQEELEMQRRQTYSLQQELYRVSRDRDALEENNRNLLSLVEWSRYSSSLQRPMMPFPTNQVAGKSGDGRVSNQKGKEEREGKDEWEEKGEGKEGDGEETGKEEQQQLPKQSLWKRILHLFQRKPIEDKNKHTTSPSHLRNRSASSPIPTGKGKEDGEYLQLQVPPHALDANYLPVTITPRSKSEDYPSSKEELYSLRRRYSHKPLSSHHSFLSNSFSNLQSPRRSSLLARVSRSPSETRSVSSESSYKNDMIHGLRIGLTMDDESDDENNYLEF